MRDAWIIAKNELRLRLRDRSVFIIGLVAPLVLAFIFNSVFGAAFSDTGETVTFDVGVVNDDIGAIGTAFDEVLAGSSDFFTVTTYPSEDAANRAIEDGEVGAVFVLDASLSEAVQSGQDATIGIIGNIDSPTTTQIASSVASQFAIAVQTANLSLVTAIGSGAVAPAEALALGQEAATADPVVTIGPIEAARKQLNSATYFVAGLSIFFLFFIAGLAVTSMLEERREGTLHRLLAAPINRKSVVAGKSLASLVIGLISMTALAAASTVVMNAEWGPPLGVGLLIFAGVLAVVGLMTIAGAFAKTPEQAGNLQSIVAVTMGMLGGTFVQIPRGTWLATLSLLTPNAWFVRGLSDMAAGDVSAGLPAVGVLLGIAAVAGTIGLYVSSRVLKV